MSFSSRELQDRLAVAGPHDLVRGMLFNAVLAYAAEQLPAEKVSELREDIAPGGPSDLGAYPVSDYLELLHAVSHGVARKLGGPVETYLRRCGGVSVRRFLESALGQNVLTVVMNRRDPHALLSMAPVAYAATLSYGHRTYRQTGERSGEYHLEGDMKPPLFHQGALEFVLEFAGRTGEVRLDVRSLTECVYSLQWEPAAAEGSS